jgi:hypothetical protein
MFRNNRRAKYYAITASGTQVIRLVLRGAAVMLAVGVGAGVAGSFAITRLLASLLWQIKPTDAPTFAASAGLILLVGVAASIVPAVRVLAVDPHRPPLRVGIVCGILGAKPLRESGDDLRAALARVVARRACDSFLEERIRNVYPNS